MRIFPYQLIFNGESLDGVLLEEEGGYSLIQPWPRLGDLSLKEHLADLKNERKLPLTQRALEILETEKKAKKENISLVPQNTPASHLIITSTENLEKEIETGVKTFKVKIGSNLDQDFALLKSIEVKMHMGAFKLRLDANCNLSAKDADDFFSKLSEKFLCSIDFVEDPIKGTPDDWIKFSEKFNLKLAHDFAPEAFRNAADVWVLKPSRENPWPLVERATHDLRRIVVTSALDHPLGHVVAAYEAAQIAEAHRLLIDECGLISFESLNAPMPFTRVGAHLDLSALIGPGFGMDKELENLSWEEF